MSEASIGVPPYRVGYSGKCRQAVKQLLLRAQAKGRFAEIARVLAEIHDRLRWTPLDFGEPLQDYTQLGITECLGVVPPLVLKYGVDEERRIVHVGLPFDLLPNSGL